MKIEIEGQDAVTVTKELLSIEGLEGNYETIDEVEREATVIATIATIVGITLGTIEIAEKLYEWKQKHQNSQLNSTGARIEKVMLIAPNGKRLLLKDATIEQIKEIMED